MANQERTGNAQSDIGTRLVDDECSVFNSQVFKNKLVTENNRRLLPFLQRILLPDNAIYSLTGIKSFEKNKERFSNAICKLVAQWHPIKFDLTENEIINNKEFFSKLHHVVCSNCNSEEFLAKLAEWKRNCRQEYLFCDNQAQEMRNFSDDIKALLKIFHDSYQGRTISINSDTCDACTGMIILNCTEMLVININKDAIISGGDSSVVNITNEFDPSSFDDNTEHDSIPFLDYQHSLIEPDFLTTLMYIIKQETIASRCLDAKIDGIYLTMDPSINRNEESRINPYNPTSKVWNPVWLYTSLDHIQRRSQDPNRLTKSELLKFIAIKYSDWKKTLQLKLNNATKEIKDKSKSRKRSAKDSSYGSASSSKYCRE